MACEIGCGASTGGISRPVALLVGLMGVLWAGGCGAENTPGDTVVRIDAAASIAYVIEAQADAIEDDLGVRITVNTAASGALVRQIEQGGRADLFISADPLWMDRLAGLGLVDESTRTDLAYNRLVLVAAEGSGLHPDTLADLADPAYGPIAVGDRLYVPAGRYAVQALLAHGLEPGRGLVVAEAPDARAALAFVLSGQCPVGLVYASDAAGARGVEVLLTVNPADHTPIRYPAAVLRDAPHRDQALRVLAWLKSERARSALRAAGFETTDVR